jgi:hypothetical protein
MSGTATTALVAVPVAALETAGEDQAGLAGRLHVEGEGPARPLAPGAGEIAEAAQHRPAAVAAGAVLGAQPEGAVDGQLERAGDDAHAAGAVGRHHLRQRRAVEGAQVEDVAAAGALAVAAEDEEERRRGGGGTKHGRHGLSVWGRDARPARRRAAA